MEMPRAVAAPSIPLSAPALRGRPAVSNHVFRYAGLADFDA
jgi:hypothetical protein